MVRMSASPSKSTSATATAAVGEAPSSGPRKKLLVAPEEVFSQTRSLGTAVGVAPTRRPKTKSTRPSLLKSAAATEVVGPVARVRSSANAPAVLR